MEWNCDERIFMVAGWCHLSDLSAWAVQRKEETQKVCESSLDLRADEALILIKD